jgi:hypothetical protein
MFGRRRRDDVPFAFIAEAERFRSNVRPPERRAGRAELAGRTLVGLLVAAGLAGSIIFGMPALQSGEHDSGTAQRPETSQTGG